MKYTFYLRIFPDGKVYVGCTNRTVEERAGKDGIQYVGQSVYAAIQKFGWRNISTEILEIRDCDEDTAAAIEEGYIDEYQSNNPHFGYNSPSAPRYHNGSKPLSPESCKKIGLSKVGRIWCYKDDDLRFATPDEWAILEQDGYKKGFTEKTITRKRNSLLSLTSVRNSEGTLKRVRSSELDNYLNSGWILEKDYQQRKRAAHEAELEERKRNRVQVPKRFIYMNGVYRFVAADVALDLVNRGLAVYDAPKHTEEDRKKISEAARRNWSKPDYREKFHKGYEARRARFESMKSDPMIAKKRADAIRASHQTPEYKAKASKALKGRVWITNGTEAKTIKPEELTQYLDSGWVRGRGKLKGGKKL